MNMIRVGVFLVYTSFLAVCSLAGDNHPETFMQQKKTVDSLKRVPEMRLHLQRAFATVESARREMEDFQAKVARGDIPIKNNNGLWCAVLDESKTVIKLATYVSKNGPMDYFMKAVFSDADHKVRLNEQGYELYISTNGTLERYMRADMQEMMKYHPDGKIESFSSKTSNGWYTAKWNGKDGQLLNESSSVGTVSDKKVEKDKGKQIIGNVSQQTTNRTVAGVPQIPGSGKTNELGTTGKP